MDWEAKGMPEKLILEMQQVSKHYPGVQALKNVDFDLAGGEVHALVGENGAGKSTLMKILAGAIPYDDGSITVGDETVSNWDPQEAQRHGIAIIYQEFNLVPYLNVAQNIFLGREQGRKGVIDYNSLYHEAARFMGQVSQEIDVRQQVRRLSAAQKQLVEIARALSMDAKILVMDEPTSSLSKYEKDLLFQLIRNLKQQGKSIIYISHRMEEIFQIADRVTVLRDGVNRGTFLVQEIDIDQLVRLTVGREIRQEQENLAGGRIKDTVLEVRNLTRWGKFHDISFSLQEGEILGMAGLVGAGRSDVARAIFGADRLDNGEVFFLGKRTDIRSPQDAVEVGIGFLPEDRKEQGLVMGMSVKENMSLASLQMISPWGVISKPRQLEACHKYLSSLDIKTPDLNQKVRNLSGGNQQKVVLAKWLALNPKILILDEPTKGIDVGAKSEIHDLIRKLAQQGISVLVISSELPELLQVCDRILVMREGELTGEVMRSAASEELIMSYATGGTNRDGARANCS